MEVQGHILVIDDDPVTRRLLEGVLTRQGFLVSVAGNGQEGLEAFRQRQPQLIILDIQMPVMDGHEFITAFKRIADIRAVPVIILTAYEDRQEVFRLEGVNDYIIKPFAMTPLIAKLKKRLRHKTKKVLVIDDESDVVRVLESRLTARGYDVLTASDGLQGLKVAKKELPDLLILDIMMPKLDGLNLCRMLKFDEKYRRMAVMFLTARAGEATRRLGFEVGADAYFNKPYNHDDILHAIKELLWD